MLRGIVFAHTILERAKVMSTQTTLGDAKPTHREENVWWPGMKRWHIVVLAVVVLLGIGVAAGYRMSVRLLQSKVAEALGPGSSIGELKIHWASLELTGLRIGAPKNWPTDRALEAERITIFPSLRSLLTNDIRIASIVVEKPYLSVLRVPGKLIMVPTLTEREKGKKTAEAGRPSSRKVSITKIELQDGIVEFFDSTVRRPPLKTRLERINGVIRDIEAPSLGTKTQFDLSAIVKGIRRDGRAKASGWVGPGHRDSSSQIVLTAVDLVSLQPYLVKKNEARVANGTLDFNLRSEVRDNKLDGKGQIILRGLEFAPSQGLLDTFMGLPRSAVINFLKNNNNEIHVDFTLKGDTSHPNFSLNETLATRIATAMAGKLGVSIKGVAEGLGTLGQKGVESAKGVAEGIGSTLRDFFGGTKK